MMAVRPAPIRSPRPRERGPLARLFVSVCSAAMTSESALVALSSGRPQAKNHDKPPVSGTRGREHRGRESESDGRDQHAMSAEIDRPFAVSGSPPSEASRIIASPTRVSYRRARPGRRSSRRARGGRTFAPRCPTPSRRRTGRAEAKEAMTAPSTTRSFHLCRRGDAHRGGFRRLRHHRLRSDALIGRTPESFRRRASQNGL